MKQEKYRFLMQVHYPLFCCLTRYQCFDKTTGLRCYMTHIPPDLLKKCNKEPIIILRRSERLISIA